MYRMAVMQEQLPATIPARHGWRNTGNAGRRMLHATPPFTTSMSIEQLPVPSMAVSGRTVFGRGKNCGQTPFEFVGRFRQPS